MPEIEQWQLIPVSYYRAKCQKCGHTVYEGGPANKAIMRLKFYGWRLVGGAPWCNECCSWRDDSEVSPK